MKILLVQSYLGGNEPLVYPIGLACIAAVLKGHDVRVLDTNLYKKPYVELRRVIGEFAPDVVGISLRNIDSTNKRVVVFYYENLKRLVEEVRSATKARVILGGSGFSMFGSEIMEEQTGVDYGVFLEGEQTIAALIENIDRPETVKGVYYRKDGAVLFTGPPAQPDLNAISPPDRDAVDARGYYSVPESIGVETKRGCALRCVYCIYGFLNGRNYRFRKPEHIVDDIETLISKYEVNKFTFVDSVFNIPQGHAEDICNEIIRRGLKVKWSAWFSEKGLEKSFIELAKKAGCVKFIFSPDGLNDNVLKSLGKNITKQEIMKAYDLLKVVDGFEICYNFFKNPPGQTLKAFVSMLFFCIKAKRELGRRVHFEFNSMRVEPHTALYDIALKEGFVNAGDNLLYPKYYTNPKTRYIEKIFNFALGLRGK